MPINHFVIAILLMLATWTVVLVGGLFGWEFYLLLPGRHGVYGPPLWIGVLIVMLILPTGLFFVSSGFSAGLFALLFLSALAGSGVGMAFFDWTPGLGQYLLMATLGATAGYFLFTPEIRERD